MEGGVMWPAAEEIMQQKDEHTKKNWTGVYKYRLWDSSSHDYIVALEK